jgi:hypothetical protein
VNKRLLLCRARAVYALERRENNFNGDVLGAGCKVLCPGIGLSSPDRASDEQVCAHAHG